MARTVRAALEEALKHDDYWQQWLISDFTEELARRLDVLGMSRTAFAAKIGAQPPYVTRVLRGEENLTAATMTKLARAVGCVVRTHLAPVGTYTTWIDFGEGYVTNRVVAVNSTGDSFTEPISAVGEYEVKAVGAGV